MKINLFHTFHQYTVIELFQDIGVDLIWTFEHPNTTLEACYVYRQRVKYKEYSDIKYRALSYFINHYQEKLKQSALFPAFMTYILGQKDG